MAKKKAVTPRNGSKQTVSFKDLKPGDRFQFVEARTGTPGRKPIFVKDGTRAYRSRLGERTITRAMSTAVRKVAR